MKANTIGVYRLTNTISGRFYIGSSINLKKRWRAHITALIGDRHPNTFLQRDFNSHCDLTRSADFITFELVRELEPQASKEETITLLRQAEQEEIDRHFDLPGCMNAVKVAGGLHYFPEERKAALRETKRVQAKRNWERPEFRELQASIRRRKEYLELQRQGALERLQDPEERCKMTKGRPEQMRAYWQSVTPERKAELAAKHLVTRTVISPTGEVVVIENLQEFCKEHGFSFWNFYRMVRGKRRKAYGYSLPQP